MGVYIKNIEMPNECSECFYRKICKHTYYNSIINEKGTIYRSGAKSKSCPLIEIDDNKIKDYIK